MDDQLDGQSQNNMVYDRESNFPNSLKKKWFKPYDSIDAEVQEMFKEDFINLEKGKYTAWEKDMDGQLAIILLTDQLSRMYHRNHKDQFKYDKIALRVCKKALADPNQFNQYRLIERLFMIFPLMHSEDKEDSQLLTEKIPELIIYSKERNYKEVGETLFSFLKAAQTFTQILTVYGRFPHRNDLIGRRSTPEEEEYIKLGKIPEYKLKQHGLKPLKNQKYSQYNQSMDRKYNRELGQVRISQMSGSQKNSNSRY